MENRVLIYEMHYIFHYRGTIMSDKKLKPGFYEQVISEHFAKQLEQVENRFKEIEPIDKTEASTVLSGYLKDIVIQGLESTKDTGESEGDATGLQRQIVLANKS